MATSIWNNQRRTRQVHQLNCPPSARPSEGHGLGLAIVKRIATMLGGEMIIQSSLGQGTQVVLRLPPAWGV